MCLNTYKMANFKKSDHLIVGSISLWFSSEEKICLLFQNIVCTKKTLSHKYLNDGSRPTLD